MVFDFNFTMGIMDFVVIVSLGVVLYSLHLIKQLEDALSVAFIALSQITKGNPVKFEVDEDGELHVSFPNLREDQEDDDDY